MRSAKAGKYGACMLLAVAVRANAGSVDAKLLDMLLANGAITEAQHAELNADLARERQEERREATELAEEKDLLEFRQLAGWAATTRLSGDVRVRNERIDIEGEPDNGGRDKDRQRIRARLGAITRINPQVETGIQIATGNGADRRSTNQDMDAYADKKSLWLDLAYIDYHPSGLPTMNFFAGKMKQPWMVVSEIAWDSDVNPEGLAARYQKKTGTTTLFGSAGYFVMKDNVDGEGVEFENDLGLYELQAGVAFDASDSVRLTLGGTINEFNGDEYGSASSFRTNGNTTDRFGLYELFGQLDLAGLPLPVSLYGQFVQNHEARDVGTFHDGDEDTAWLFGLRTNVGGITFDYNYRDVEANAVIGGFTESDFAAGYTNSSGHKLKAQYDFLANFNLGVTYYLTESDAASRYETDADVDVLFLDINARF